MAQWDTLVDGALASLAARRVLLNTRLIALAPPPPPSGTSFAGPGPWDRATVEIQVDRASIRQWLAANGEVSSREEEGEVNRELILFSGNDYLCLRSHPAVREAAVKAAQEYGMGPRGSSLICGYTTYHKLVEGSLAELQKKEDCLLCPTGFSANTALMSALGSISSLLAAGRKPAQHERIAIFSDALNHASTIDGIRLVERQHQAVAFVYKHSDMSHLDFLLSGCPMEKKVVVTDSLFSMDGDFAPLPQLVELRKKHGFLLVVDDAHGIPELFGCEDDIDICVGSLSKGAGCQGGFIACSTRWKRLILSRGRSFIFSTALPLPVVASVHAAIHVAKKEPWRRSVIWEHVQHFASLTKLNVTSPIIVIIVGSEEAAIKAHRHHLSSGFLVQPIRPHVVPPNSSSTRWKRLILSRGRSFIFSTALPLPVVASVHAAIHVAKKEPWRRSVIWEHVQHFASLTKLNVTSPIIVIIVGSEEAAIKAHRHHLSSGFLVQPIRPHVVPPNSSRLRITLSCAHTSDDIRRLVDALAPWLPTHQYAEQGCASVSRL